MKRIAIKLLRLFAPICDPLRAFSGLLSYPRYFGDWWRYARLDGAESLRVADAFPQLGENTAITRVDPHYFYVNGWAMRRIVAQRPAQHVDIGSQTMFINMLGAVVPVTYVDYRPLEACIDGITNRRGDILNRNVSTILRHSRSEINVQFIGRSICGLGLVDPDLGG